MNIYTVECAVAMPPKKCSKCCAIKPPSEFYSRPNTPDGLRRECKACVKSRNAAYVQRNLKKVAAYKAGWCKENFARLSAEKKAKYRANPERCKQVVKEWAKKNVDRVRAIKARWKKNNPEYCRAENARRRALDPEKFRLAVRKWSKRNLVYFREKNMRRHAAKLRAVPPWSETDKIAVVYQKAQQYGMEVDHVVPLQSPLVCGLHVWANLQLLTRLENTKKKNYHWPDMP